MAFELVPFAEIKSILGLTGSSVDEYPALGVILNRLTSSFQEFTDRLFEQKVRTEELFISGTGVAMIPLKALPVISVTSVEVSSYSYGLETLGGCDFYITNYGLRLYTKVKNSNVKVTYLGGLSESSDELKAAAVYQASYEFQSKEQIGANSVSNEGGSVYRPPLGLLSETKRMLTSSIHPLQMGHP